MRPACRPGLSHYASHPHDVPRAHICGVCFDDEAAIFDFDELLEEDLADTERKFLDKGDSSWLAAAKRVSRLRKLRVAGGVADVQPESGSPAGHWT